MRKFLNNLISSSILHLRPLFGSIGSCRYTISCTDYGAEQFKKSESFFKTAIDVSYRLIKCFLGI